MKTPTLGPVLLLPLVAAQSTTWPAPLSWTASAVLPAGTGNNGAPICGQGYTYCGYILRDHQSSWPLSPFPLHSPLPPPFSPFPLQLTPLSPRRLRRRRHCQSLLRRQQRQLRQWQDQNRPHPSPLRLPPPRRRILPAAARPRHQRRQQQDAQQQPPPQEPPGSSRIGVGRVDGVLASVDILL